MAGLDRVRVKGFKSIKEIDIKLKPLNVMVGANGAGKSNFISFFKLLNDLVNENLQNAITKAGGPESLLYFGNKETEEINFDLYFGQNSYHVVWEVTDDSKIFFSSEKLAFLGEGYINPKIENLGSGHYETEIRKESKRNRYKTVIADYIIRNLVRWKVYHFHDTSDSSKIKQNCLINDNDYFKEDGSNLASYLYYLKEKHNDSYLAILKTVQLVAPFIKDFHLEPLKLKEDSIRLKWIHMKSTEYFDVSQLSDGTLRFICIAILLLQPELLLPNTIILDEPELGLHPYSIKILSSLFKSVSKKTQIIISTQSLLLMDNFDPEDIIVVDYINNESILKRLDIGSLEKWLEEYSLGELWEKNLLGGRPR